MRVLRNMEGKPETEWETKEQREKLKINTLEGKVTNNRIRWCGYI
jgi:hypothetical protein